MLFVLEPEVGFVFAICKYWDLNVFDFRKCLVG